MKRLYLKDRAKEKFPYWRSLSIMISVFWINNCYMSYKPVVFTLMQSCKSCLDIGYQEIKESIHFSLNTTIVICYSASNEYYNCFIVLN